MNRRPATFSKFILDSFFHSLLWSRTVADGAAAGLIVFITETSAFCFFNPEHRGIIQAVKAIFVKLENKCGQRKTVFLSECSTGTLVILQWGVLQLGLCCSNIKTEIILNFVVWVRLHLTICLTCVPCALKFVNERRRIPVAQFSYFS